MHIVALFLSVILHVWGGGVFRNIVYLSNPIIKTSYVKVYLNTIEQRHRNDVPDCFAHA